MLSDAESDDAREWKKEDDEREMSRKKEDQVGREKEIFFSLQPPAESGIITWYYYLKSKSGCPSDGRPVHTHTHTHKHKIDNRGEKRRKEGGDGCSHKIGISNWMKPGDRCYGHQFLPGEGTQMGEAVTPGVRIRKTLSPTATE